VKESEPVFLSIVTKDEYGVETILWKDVDSEQTLDPLTLLPSNGVRIENYSLAVIGDAFEIILDNPDILKFVLISSNIYARMTPTQKMRLIEEYQKIGYFTSMCGDGANDCGALKAAHVGVSLSQAEASIAAPFTSTVSSIACIPKIIREGRASLSSSYQMFKYMSTYSYIQFIAIIILYSINSNLGDFQFLWVDLFIILPIAALMGNTGATNVLVKERPPNSLISKHVLLSLFGQLSLAAGFQIFAYFDLLNQSFYKPTATGPGEKNILCYETSTIFLLSSFQTLSVALAYSISKPFKKPLHTNYSYTFMLLLLFIASSYIILYPHKYVMDILELMNFPMPYRIRLYIITLIHLMVSWTYERILILGPGAVLLDKVRKPTLAKHEILSKEFAELKKREGINIVISK
jgi:cation-transporting ATPase 13A2